MQRGAPRRANPLEGEPRAGTTRAQVAAGSRGLSRGKCPAGGVQPALTARSAGARDGPDKIGFVLDIGRAVGIENIVKPGSGRVVVPRPVPRIRGQISLRLAVDESPVVSADPQRFSDGQGAFERASQGPRHILRAKHWALERLQPLGDPFEPRVLAIEVK